MSKYQINLFSIFAMPKYWILVVLIFLIRFNRISTDDISYRAKAEMQFSIPYSESDFDKMKIRVPLSKKKYEFLLNDHKIEDHAEKTQIFRMNFMVPSAHKSNYFNVQIEEDDDIKNVNAKVGKNKLQYEDPYYTKTKIDSITIKLKCALNFYPENGCETFCLAYTDVEKCHKNNGSRYCIPNYILSYRDECWKNRCILEPGLCNKQGKCVFKDLRNFTCNCYQGYYGKNCEKSLPKPVQNLTNNIAHLTNLGEQNRQIDKKENNVTPSNFFKNALIVALALIGLFIITLMAYFINKQHNALRRRKLSTLLSKQEDFFMAPAFHRVKSPAPNSVQNPDCVTRRSTSLSTMTATALGVTTGVLEPDFSMKTSGTPFLEREERMGAVGAAGDGVASSETCDLLSETSLQASGAAATMTSHPPTLTLQPLMQSEHQMMEQHLHHQLHHYPHPELHHQPHSYAHAQQPDYVHFHQVGQSQGIPCYPIMQPDSVSGVSATLPMRSMMPLPGSPPLSPAGGVPIYTSQIGGNNGVGAGGGSTSNVYMNHLECSEFPSLSEAATAATLPYPHAHMMPSLQFANYPQQAPPHYSPPQHCIPYSPLANAQSALHHHNLLFQQPPQHSQHSQQRIPIGSVSAVNHGPIGAAPAADDSSSSCGGGGASMLPDSQIGAASMMHTQIRARDSSNTNIVSSSNDENCSIDAMSYSVNVPPGEFKF